MAETTTVEERLAALVEQGFVTDNGVVEAIFVRPSVDLRTELTSGRLTAEAGVEGDRWAEGARPGGDGGPDTRTQITLMNARVLNCVAGSRDRWELAGDQLIVDLDLSEANLPIGQRLRLGEAIVSVTDVPHQGCGKFRRRFGSPALDYINHESRQNLRLRGVYVQVESTGTVSRGDRITKL